jgi:putative hydrolase of the HAD superfamily
MKQHPVETLLFDFGGTLDGDGVAWKERFHEYYRAEGLDMAAEAFQPCFFAADSSLVGNLPRAADLAATVHALAARLEAELTRAAPPGTGGAGSRNGRGARVAARFLLDASAAFARNRPVLQTLRKQYRLGVVSNFYGNLEAVCRSADLHSLFSVLIDSHHVGAEKPDPAIFHAALGALGASPETTILIGDSLRRDGEGARRTGMRFVWMMSPDAHDSESKPSELPSVDFAVTELHALTSILQ